MNLDILPRLFEPIRRRIALMIRRAVIDIVNDDNPVQTMQLKCFRNECRQGVERIQEYGYSSVPPAGGQAVMACVDGECGHELVIATDDRRYRPRERKSGDVMIYTATNRKDGADTEHHILLEAEPRFIGARAKNIVIDADESIELRTAGGKNFIRIGPEDYGIRISVDGGFENGGSDVRIQGGKIWHYGAEKLISRTRVNRSEIPPTPMGETGEPTMPE